MLISSYAFLFLTPLQFLYMIHSKKKTKKNLLINLILPCSSNFLWNKQFWIPLPSAPQLKSSLFSDWPASGSFPWLHEKALEVVKNYCGQILLLVFVLYSNLFNTSIIVRAEIQFEICRVNKAHYWLVVWHLYLISIQLTLASNWISVAWSLVSLCIPVCTLR